MAVRVVDRLEAVQVQEHHADAVLPALALHDRLLQAVGQQHAVRQPGQQVVVRDVLQLVLVLLHQRDVGEQRRRTAPMMPSGVAHRR
jgi:hypothetical protein